MRHPFLPRDETLKPTLHRYDYAVGDDYVPERLHAANIRLKKIPAHSAPNRDLVGEGDAATTNECPKILVPNWLAWTVVIGISVFILAVIGWIVRPRTFFLEIATLAMVIVTACLIYGEYYLNKHADQW